MVKVFDKALKSPIGRKRFKNIKSAVMSDQEIVLEIIQKIGYTGKAFAVEDYINMYQTVI